MDNVIKSAFRYALDRGIDSLFNDFVTLAEKHDLTDAQVAGVLESLGEGDLAEQYQNWRAD